MSPVYCKYHCRHCDSHFTSLTAFDTHRVDGVCWGGELGDEDPADAGLTERRGVCRISTPGLSRAVSVYEHESASRVRDHFHGGSAA